ncbi:nudix hydrolase YeaB [Klebsiella pneumoniae subsp. ozaenae]|uniref:Nudix hydrolase YeaB n=1 Tax=Klebsiella pneumoniae subsp. ozaenae TaxID=574 RepID=A0A378BFW8_KLEPO|nr:nudix hydrolase YeaB [Klebsiella pneumoniae subsp. ozaenae]
MPIVRRPQPGLLLTQRSPLLRKHAGQVAFPGGAVDNTDATLIAAALREAQEEVAIPPEAVEVIGVLPPVDSVTGFQVTPVVGIIPPGSAPITPARTKSPRLFEMPLAEALRLGRYHPLDIHRRGNDHRVWLSWYQHYFCLGNDRPGSFASWRCKLAHVLSYTDNERALLIISKIAVSH